MVQFTLHLFHRSWYTYGALRASLVCCWWSISTDIDARGTQSGSPRPDTEWHLLVCHNGNIHKPEYLQPLYWRFLEKLRWDLHCSACNHFNTDILWTSGLVTTLAPFFLVAKETELLCICHIDLAGFKNRDASRPRQNFLKYFGGPKSHIIHLNTRIYIDFGIFRLVKQVILTVYNQVKLNTQ